MEADLSEYYPPEVDDNTPVSVVIEYNGNLYLYEGRVAQSFGWTKRPTPSMYPWMESESATITHYKIIR
jgi:hypothetical protein